MAEKGEVIVIHSEEEWNAQLENGNESKKLIVVDFTATWCGPCKMMAPIFAELAEKHSNVIFLKVDVDDLNGIATKWEVRAMPTFIFIKESKLVDKIVGANIPELQAKIAEYATDTSS